MHIYVGNFPEDTTEQDLRTAFEPFGQILSVKIITDPISRRILGFGFVDMPNVAEGERAIAALNQTKVKGRMIMVARTKDRVERRVPIPRPT